MEEKVKRVRVYSEEEKIRRREAERKRMADPELRAAKLAKDRLRMESKEVRDRKRAMDRDRQKLVDVAARNLASHRKYRKTGKFKEWEKQWAEKTRAIAIENSIGRVCAIVLVKCLDCGCIETKRPHLVKDGKASSAYCSVHAKQHRRSYGVDYKKFEIICSDCGIKCKGAGNRKVCNPCGKARFKERKRNDPNEIARKKEQGVSLRSRARKHGAYMDTVNVRKVFERDKWRCVSCHCKVERTRHYQPNRATIDHRIPLSRGGSHTYENCQTMCVMCNSKKEASMPTGVQLTVFDRVA